MRARPLTPEEVVVITEAVKEICAQRGVDPISSRGRDIAERFIVDCMCGEPVAALEQQLRLH